VVCSVLVPWENSASFLPYAVGSADLHQLRLRSDGLRNVRIYLSLIAGWVSQPKHVAINELLIRPTEQVV
jgi:hypothetical protein